MIKIGIKKTGLFYLFLIANSFIYSQSFEQSNHYIAAAYGLVSFDRLITESIPHAKTSSSYKGIGPIFIKYEYAINSKIGLGLHFAYSDNEVTATSNNYTTSIGTTIDLVERITYTSYNILGRFNYHFGESKKLDPYLGLGFGFMDFSATFEENDPYAEYLKIERPLGKMSLEATFGTRFFFTDNVGVFAEFGISKALFQMGLSGKF